VTLAPGSAAGEHRGGGHGGTAGWWLRAGSRYGRGGVEVCLLYGSEESWHEGRFQTRKLVRSSVGRKRQSFWSLGAHRLHRRAPTRKRNAVRLRCSMSSTVRYWVRGEGGHDRALLRLRGGDM
jgi:hypothetical protein